MGTAVLGDMNKVMRGIASIENPKPVSPCRTAEKKKINNPINISWFILFHLFFSSEYKSKTLFFLSPISHLCKETNFSVSIVSKYLLRFVLLELAIIS